MRVLVFVTKKPRSDCPGQVNFTLGQVRMEVCGLVGK